MFKQLKNIITKIQIPNTTHPPIISIFMCARRSLTCFALLLSQYTW